MRLHWRARQRDVDTGEGPRRYRRYLRDVTRRPAILTYYFEFNPYYYLCGSRRAARPLHVEYAERGQECGILFMCSLFCEYIHLEYGRMHVIYRVNQAEHVIHILVVAPQEYVEIYSTCRARPPMVSFPPARVPLGFIRVMSRHSAVNSNQSNVVKSDVCNRFESHLKGALCA